ncbi:MAG: 30S ribosomal protein S5 [Nanoarchaeota archaeon]
MPEEQKKKEEDLVEDPDELAVELAEGESESKESSAEEASTDEVSDDAVESEEDIPEVEDAKSKEEALKLRELPFDIEAWHPKTEIGRMVKKGQWSDLGTILAEGNKILEPEVVDILLPGLQSDLLLIGQAKGKFGGGQRRVFRQTQKKTREGNKPSFATCAVIGNNNGFVGLGYGKARETVPAREKAIKDAKRNVIMIKRGSGSWEGAGEYPNSIPFKVSGKCGSVVVELIPAPNGTGLCIESECAKMLKLAGIKDVWSRTQGQAKTKINQVRACFEALKKLSETKVRAEDIERFNIVAGRVVE